MSISIFNIFSYRSIILLIPTPSYCTSVNTTHQCIYPVEHFIEFYFKTLINRKHGRFSVVFRLHTHFKISNEILKSVVNSKTIIYFFQNVTLANWPLLNSKIFILHRKKNWEYFWESITNKCQTIFQCLQV